MRGTSWLLTLACCTIYYIDHVGEKEKCRRGTKKMGRNLKMVVIPGPEGEVREKVRWSSDVAMCVLSHAYQTKEPTALILSTARATTRLASTRPERNLGL